jgi:sortase A
VRIRLNTDSGSRTKRQQLGRFLQLLGLCLIGLYALLRLNGYIANYAGLKAFSVLTNTAAADPMPDFTLWDSKRVEAYKQTLLKNINPPLGVLEIDKLDLQVSIFEGTSDFVLDRGVGHIEWTERIAGKGNIGIAGHRDGFFRGLKDLVRGDDVRLIALDATYIYKIDQILIVDPEEISVLDSGPTPTLTLVTCYPFYFVGHAPKRYIIKASLIRTTSIKDFSK